MEPKRKPGWKTTEFWTMVGTVIYTGFWADIPPEVQGYIVAGVTTIYKIIRGVTKSSEAKNGVHH